jgi:hypothetical protein
MNPLDQLNSYLKRVEVRLRVFMLARGAALTALAALLSTVLLVLLANSFAFSEASLVGSRILLSLALACALGFGLLVPVLRLSRRNAARGAEEKCPQFEQRLLTLAEISSSPASEPFLELLAADTLRIAREAQPERLVAGRRIFAFICAAALATLTLVWLMVSGPGYLGYGAWLLWSGTPRGGIGPFYNLLLSPGDRTVRRGADQLVTARPVGFEAPQVRLFARYRSASKWEEVSMQPQPGSSDFGFLFAGLPDTLDYYAQAGRVRSQQHTLTIVDLPSVQRIRITYRFPRWTGLKDAVEEPGGDLRAVEGTEAEIAVQTDRPLNRGALVLDDSSQVPLSAGQGNWRTARLTLRKDGLYHIAALEQGEPIRLSEDYFIEARKDSAPVVRIARPGRDARVNPIEEVPVLVEAADDFGLQELELRYSVNGGPERTVPLLRQQGLKEAEGAITLYLEDSKLAPGDIVSLYAAARDARASTKTDIYFVEAQPFEREYSQSQQMGGGAGGGEGNEQSRISQRQKEIIAATWNELRSTARDRNASAENAAFLADVQAKLRDQARSLATRIERRELSRANQEFSSFSRDMTQAAEAMGAAAEKLKASQWQQALTPEQKALQHLLRAQATFRQIQVAFGNRAGGGRGGGGMGRDLENLFDLELDTEKNQYEARQQPASPDQRAREIDEALQRLEQLARRQQELAQQQRRQPQSFQQRWQQEMLRREAEQLQRRMEQLTRGGSSQQAGGSQQVEQALRRLEEATRDMRQAGAAQSGGSSRGEAESRRAAERLREARDLLGRLRRQEASQLLDDMVRRADRLAEQQQDFADRLRQSAAAQPQPQPQPGTRPAPSLQPGQNQRQAQEMAAEKDRMAAELQRLERNMQDAARDLASSQRPAASRLRQALGNMQQDELALRMRYNAEMIRRGLGPLVWMREAPVTEGLRNLRDQLREAQAALDRSPGGQLGMERALAQLERLRNRIQAGGPRRGDFSAMNRGDLRPPEGGVEPTERAWRESLRELSQIRQMVQANPEIARDVQELIREIERLDPKRFPGNPELVERLRSQVLPSLEQLELQLRRTLEGDQAGQVRSGASEPIPTGYAAAVAEYFRRLSKER